MNVLSILERNFRHAAIPAGPPKEKTRAIWPGPFHSVNYQVTFAPPATMAPSRPATITINFFIVTTPNFRFRESRADNFPWSPHAIAP
jgi:hypothetical protein